MIAAAFLALTLILQADPSVQAKRFVQEFYDWYTPTALSDISGPAFERAVTQRPAVFSSELVRALKADGAAQKTSKEGIVGIDWDPFLFSQDPCERYIAGRVTAGKSGYLVEVLETCEKGAARAQPVVIAEVIRSGTSWHFADFRYPELKGGLLDHLAFLREQRLRHH